MNEGITMKGQWKVMEHDIYGQLISEHESPNIVVNIGRDKLIALLFGFASSTNPFAVPIVSMAVGGSSVANDNVTAGALNTDTRLTYEYRGNATRKTFTNVNNVALSMSDRVVATTTLSGTTYYEYIVLQSQFAAGDGNNGLVFNEYGLFDSTVLPSSPTASSGYMFNRFVDPAPITKSSSNAITVQVTLSF